MWSWIPASWQNLHVFLCFQAANTVPTHSNPYDSCVVSSSLVWRLLPYHPQSMTPCKHCVGGRVCCGCGFDATMAWLLLHRQHVWPHSLSLKLLFCLHTAPIADKLRKPKLLKPQPRKVVLVSAIQECPLFPRSFQNIFACELIIEKLDLPHTSSIILFDTVTPCCCTVID